jgi:hypothetical protein
VTKNRIAYLFRLMMTLLVGLRVKARHLVQGMAMLLPWL